MVPFWERFLLALLLGEVVLVGGGRLGGTGEGVGGVGGVVEFLFVGFGGDGVGDGVGGFVFFGWFLLGVFADFLLASTYLFVLLGRCHILLNFFLLNIRLLSKVLCVNLSMNSLQHFRLNRRIGQLNAAGKILREWFRLEELIRFVVREFLRSGFGDGLTPLGHQFSILLVESSVFHTFFRLFHTLSIPGHGDEIVEDEVDCVVIQILALVLLFFELG
jgi:hypothetical protein